MTAGTAAPARAAQAAPAPAPPDAPTPSLRRVPWTRVAPALVAAALAAAYVIVAPPSVDLAAHLFRAHLFAQEGVGIWNNFWYSGHATPGYSVLFPAVSAALGPRLAAALAAVGTAVVFERLATRHFGPRASMGAVAFGAATAIDLYTGRLTLAFGALPALAAIAALDRGWTAWGCALAALAALCSPVAALFTAIAAGGRAVAELVADHGGKPALAAAAVAAAALGPVAVLALSFGDPGTEPFALSTLLPLVAIEVGAFAAVPAGAIRLRATIAVYTAATVVAYAVPSAVGSNVARLGTVAAAPLAALLWWRRRPALLALLALPLLYVGWQAPVRDVAETAGDPSVSAAYYRPLLRYLRAQPGVFRVEIPLTRSHWEAWWVARSVPIARGWERQLDIADNPLFYGGRLTAGAYERWLHRTAVRFVALPDAALDYSARAESALIRHGLPYLRPVMRSAHWRVYAVADATPMATGPASLTAMGPDHLTLRARGAGSTVVRVHFSPYWRLSGPAAAGGCVASDGAWTRIELHRAGRARLSMRFAPARIGARSPRCTPDA